MAGARHQHDQRWVRRIAREAAQRRLRRARDAVSEAQRARRSAARRARLLCRGARAALRAWVATERARLRDEIARLRSELASAIESRRKKVRACCGPDRERVRAQHTRAVEQARVALDQLRAEAKRERIWQAAPAKPFTAQESRARSRERRQESDEAVEVELSPDERIVWAAVKKQLKPHPRASRVETLRHWIHDHSGDVEHILARHAERELQAAIAREKRERADMDALRRELRKRRPAQLSELVNSELEAVPF